MNGTINKLVCQQQTTTHTYIQYLKEAVGGVADTRGKNLVPQHGVDDGALPV